MHRYSARAALVVVLVAALMAPAFAELTVSVTLSGPLDEILPILEHLREMGVGSAKDEGGLRLEMHSTAEGAAAPESAGPEAAAPEGGAPEAPAGPSIAGFNVQPSSPKVGETVVLSVLVLNGAGVVDTVSASFVGVEAQFELYDNGEHGDAVAGDGQWSAQVQLPPQLPAGVQTLEIKAFDANGVPVKIPDPQGQPADLTAKVEMVTQP